MFLKKVEWIKIAGLGTTSTMATEYTVRLWSKAYSPLNDNDTYSIQVDQRIWERIIREELGSRVFIRIKGLEDGKDWFAPMGAPVRQTDFHSPNESEDDTDEQAENNYNIYVPLWMLDEGKFFGFGEPRDIQFMSEDSFPEASKITLRVIDSAFYNSDVKEELERALTSIGVIRQGSTIQLPVSFLDGYLIDIFISKTEPADVVLCDGEEVEVEFEEPVDQVPPSPPPPEQRPPTPIPEEPEILIPEPLPLNGFTAFQGTGRRLDGSVIENQGPAPAPPPRNVSYAAFEPTPVQPTQSGGRTLGSDPSIAPPSWRQGLPVRRAPPVKRNFPHI